MGEMGRRILDRMRNVWQEIGERRRQAINGSWWWSEELIRANDLKAGSELGSD